MSDELREKAKEVVSAIRSINKSPHHLVVIDEDEDPCYWQREEWVEWILEMADELESEIVKDKVT